MAKSKKQIQHEEVVLLFADRLREQRRSRGMTQVQLAEQAEVTVSYISKLERGAAAPGIDLVFRLSQALGIPLADLLPVTRPPDDLAVLREQAKRVFTALIETGDRQTLTLLNQFLARLAETGSTKP